MVATAHFVCNAHPARGIDSIRTRAAKLELIQGLGKMADGALNMGELL
jgi:hypothetical protein